MVRAYMANGPKSIAVNAELLAEIAEPLRSEIARDGGTLTLLNPATGVQMLVIVSTNQDRIQRVRVATGGKGRNLALGCELDQVAVALAAGALRVVR